MAGSFHSDDWYRVENLRPTLRPSVRIYRHRYRNRAWYVLQDAASGRTLRVTPEAARLIEQLDGTRSVGAVWDGLVADTARTPPRQDELIDVLHQAHSLDLLQSDGAPAVPRLAERRSRQEGAKFRSQFANPLSFRLPLFDPDRFLTKTAPLVRPFVTPLALIAWLAVVGWAAASAVVHWTDLSSNWHDRLFTLGNLAAIWMIYPVVKALHEMGHAYVVKVFGGEVHEMGVMFIYLTPVPYVDASAANAFPSRWQRIAVSAAGIVVELLLASGALAVWLTVEPGLLRAMAFNVLLICGASTVLFNGNPLMRYDGYFVLADWIEMPNLAALSAAFWQRLLQKRLFGVQPHAAPERSRRERAWLALYQIGSVVYRTFIALSIALWLAAQFFFVGVALALLIVWSTLVTPLWKSVRFLIADVRLHGRRGRAVLVSCAVAAAAIALLVLVPLPLKRQVEGVVWIPEDAQIRATEAGFIERVLVAPGDSIGAGEPVFLSVNRELAAELRQSEARVRQLEVEYSIKAFSDRVAAAVALDSIQTETVKLDRLRERQAQLIARSGVGGTLSVARADDLKGRFVRKGELLGYVLDGSPRIVRAVVEQDNVDLVRSHLVGAELRVASALGDVQRTHVLREVPAGINDLPSAALSMAGGGRIAQDPKSTTGMKSLDRVFQFDFALGQAESVMPVGTRVYLRLTFEPESLAQSGYREVRRLMLTRLGV
jgi:putative peptide zinc metalloprotease protein